MKKIVFVVIAMLVAGLAGYSIAQDKKPASKPTLTRDAGTNKPSLTREAAFTVTDLPVDVVKGLKVEDLVLVVAYKKDGSAEFFKPSDAKMREVTFPLDAKVLGVESVSILAVEGSACIIYIPARTVAGRYYPEICIQ